MRIDKWNDKMFIRHHTPYHGLAGLVERYRIRRVEEYAKISPSDAVLEIGCEAGNLLASLPKAKKLVGFDISVEALKEAKKTIRKSAKKAVFVKGDATARLPFKKGEFDVIICSETLEHIVKPDKAIERIHAICGPHTRVVITVPNEKPKLEIKKILTKLGVMGLIMPGIEENQSDWHLHAFSKPMILGLMKKHFVIEKSASILGLHVIVKARAK